MGTYKVEHIADNDTTITDISAFIHSVDYVNFYSDGRINTASLTLKASGGKFITNSSSGATPILKNFDRLRITWTDSNSNEYKHIFEIINDLGQLTNLSEYILPLTLEGRERNLALIPFSGYFDPETHFDMTGKILSTYLISKGTRQPLIDTITDTPGNDVNLLPKFNPNIWDFQYIDNCLDAIKAVVRLADQSVASGGGGDRFAIIFRDSATTINKMTMLIVSQGSLDQTPPTIRANALTNPISVISKIKQPPTGTVVIARGRPGSGGTPSSGDVYRSRLEFYQRIQARQFWVNTTAYKKDALASFNNQVYRAKIDNINKQPNTNPTEWETHSVGQFIGDVQYSPFTQDKAVVFKNECTNPAATFASLSETSPKMLDCNIVINDAETQRDWVYIRQVTDVVSGWSTNEKAYLFKNTDIYEGFRMLLDSSKGTLAGVFAAGTNTYGTGNGKDPRGKPFANNPVIFNDGKWYVIKPVADFDQIVVRFEGLFEWNTSFVAKSRFPGSDISNSARRHRRESGTSGTRGWRILGDQFLANDCLHSPSSITNIAGLKEPIARASPLSGNYTDNSAVRIVYEYGADSNLPEWRKDLDQILGIATSGLDFITRLALDATIGLYNLFLTPFYRNVGWWITLSAPFPFSDHNGITEQVGQLYGAGTSFGVEVLNDHAYFDAYNETATPTGKNGWNESDSAELMEITGATFLYRLDIQLNGNTIPYTGDIPCSYWAIDDNGTIWKSKKKYRLLGDIQRMTFDFGDFTPVYRARTPFGINSIVTNILAPELEIRERLFPNRIKIQGFMLEAAYDDKGRYMPQLWEHIIKPTIIQMFDPTTISTNVKFIGDFDNFQWIKTPIAIARNPTLSSARVIFPDIKDYPNISNIEQLQRAADADIDVEGFQYEQYVITRNDKADINLQDTVFLFEKNLIPDAEAPRPASATAYSGSTTYAVDNLVSSVSKIYIALKISLNKTPASNPEFWLELTDPVANTRELTVGEISLSVTDQKETQSKHTLIRRIPRVVT